MRTPLKISAALISVGLLAGCGSLNAGSAMADELDQLVEETDGLASAESTANNALPFVGELESTVTLDEDLSRSEIEEIITLLTDFEPGNFTPSIIAPLEHSDAQILLDTYDPEANIKLLDYAYELDSDTLESFSLTPSSIDLVTTQDLLHTLDQTYAQHPYFEKEAEWNVASSDDLFSFRTLDPSAPSEARLAYEKVKAEYLVTAAHVDDFVIMLTLSSMEHKEVEQTLKTMAPNVDVAISYPGVVKKVPGDYRSGDYQLLDAAVEPLLEDPEISGIELEPFKATITTSSIDKLFDLDQDINYSSLPVQVRTYYLHDAGKFKINDFTGEKEYYREVFKAASKKLEDSSLEDFWLRDANLWVTLDDANEKDAATLGQVLSEHAPVGALIMVNMNRLTFTVKIGPDGTYEDFELLQNGSGGKKEVKAFKEAFNN